MLGGYRLGDGAQSENFKGKIFNYSRDKVAQTNQGESETYLYICVDLKIQ